MPLTSKAFLGSTALLLLVGLLVLIGIVGTNLWLVGQTQVYFNEVVEARDARAAAVDLRALLQDAETSQRGYIITLDEDYLEPYGAALPLIDQTQDRLEAILAPYPAAQAPLQQLRVDIAAKLDEMARTIALTQQDNRAEAVRIIRTDAGKEAMDRSRTLFSALITAADARLTDGVERQRGTADLLRVISIVGALIIFAVVTGGIWAVTAYMRVLDQARREVEAANTSLEMRVRERTADLGRANDEIQRFAYIVTHDLRAPLVNVMGFTSELEAGVDSLRAYMDSRPVEDDQVSAEARQAAGVDLPEAISFIRAGTRKMDGLINAILKISREGRRVLKAEQVDIAELATASAAAVHHQIAENNGKIDIDMRVGSIFTDRLSIEQALGNLLDNAVKYREQERPLAVEIRARHLPGDRIEIEVEDNGRGIAASDHERIFELFRRSGSPAQPGEGIGLSHVRTLVRSLGGDITVRSTLGAGSTFTINLPRDLRRYLGMFGK